MACATTDHEKVEKHDRKMSFFLSGDPAFLPNRPKKGPFLLSVRFLERGQGRLLP
jgi:hypothetical protein